MVKIGWIFFSLLKNYKQNDLNKLLKHKKRWACSVDQSVYRYTSHCVRNFVEHWTQIVLACEKYVYIAV